MSIQVKNGVFFAQETCQRYIPFFFITPYARSQANTGLDLSIYLLPILNAASTAGRILPGYVADLLKTGPLNILIPCTAAVWS